MMKPLFLARPACPLVTLAHLHYLAPPASQDVYIQEIV